jgi:hypothetical protein
MPMIYMRDAFGSNFTITTKSRDLLQAWFDEWLPQLYPPGLEPEYGDPVITSIHALPLAPPPSKEFDWVTDSRWLGQQFTIPRDPAKALDALDRQRRFLEAHE